jgi:hypothetical protein
MAKADVEADFPALKSRDYELSEQDFNFNCLAYALGDQTNWWEPPRGSGRYWPAGFPADVTIQTAESIIRTHGFTAELDAAIEPDTDAIAIYGQGHEWTHFAKFVQGVWSSKLGEGHDVVRFRLQDLEGSLYGRVVKVLSRPKEGAD